MNIESHPDCGYGSHPEHDERIQKLERLLREIDCHERTKWFNCPCGKELARLIEQVLPKIEKP